MTDEDFSKKLRTAVDERLRVIASNEERLVEAWVAQHGWKPDETQIVRQDFQDGKMRMWVEKRGDFEELRRYREREPLVQRLLDCNTLTELRCLTKDVRDFKLSASAAAEAEADESA